MTSSDLSVNFMQQESLLELKACIDTESSESDLSAHLFLSLLWQPQFYFLTNEKNPLNTRKKDFSRLHQSLRLGEEKIKIYGIYG